MALLRKRKYRPDESDPAATSDGGDTAPPVPAKCSFWERKNARSEGICKECGTAVTGNFCSHCGQKTTTERFRFRSILTNFLGAIFNIEKGIFKTIAMLFTRPGYMSRDYIEGKRRSYTNPFSLMVLLAGIYSIFYLIMLWTQSGVTSTLDAMDADINVGYLFGGRLSPELEEVFTRVIRWLFDSAVVLSLSMLPVYTLFIKLFFVGVNRRRYNYTELMYASGYIAAQRFIIDLAEILFRWTVGGGEYYYELRAALYLIFTVVTLRQLFGTGWIGTFLRTLGIFLFSLLFIGLILLGLIVGVYWISTGENFLSV